MLWYLVTPFPYTSEDAAQWKEKVRLNFETAQEINWAIFVKNGAEDDITLQFYGSVTLRKDGVIGFWALPDGRGRGHMTAAVKMVIEYARSCYFGERENPLGVGNVLRWAGLTPNLGSAAVAYKCGFTFLHAQDLVHVAGLAVAPDRYFPWSDKRFEAVLKLEQAPITGADLAHAQESWPAIIRYARGFGKDVNMYYNEEIPHFEGTQKLLQLLDDADFCKQYHISSLASRVLHQLSKIKRGEVISYAELAARSGKPKAVRAVATIVGKNPFPLLIPCHRIVPKVFADGKSNDVGKYFYGAAAKRHLLKMEGVV
jgi:O-6-methylguanine DNA methyltransferase